MQFFNVKLHVKTCLQTIEGQSRTKVAPRFSITWILLPNSDEADNS